jgi:hypothetical protein
MMRRVFAFACAAFFAFALSSCSSTEPGGAELLPVTETVEVEVFGDAFVKSNGRRIPRERFVLELRHRVRAMEPKAAAGVRVVISQSDDAPEQATRDAEWILDQLQIMGVGQATYR